MGARIRLAVKTLNHDRLLQPEPSRNPKSRGGIDCGCPIVGHNSQTSRQRFRLAHGKWFPNIEHTKKYKTRQKIFPVGLDGSKYRQRMIRPDEALDYVCAVTSCESPKQQRQLLPRDFINHNELRIVRS